MLPSAPEIGALGDIPQHNRIFTGRDKLLDDLRGRVTNKLLRSYRTPYIASVALGRPSWQLNTHTDMLLNMRLSAGFQQTKPPLLAETLPHSPLVSGITGLIPIVWRDRRRCPRRSKTWRPIYTLATIIGDNADQPQWIHSIMPAGPGDIIVTSRNRDWAQIVDSA